MRNYCIDLCLIGLLIICALPAGSDVVINEIMYHPESDQDDDEYIELVNTGSETVNLSDWSIKGINYKFPAGSEINSGQYLVVAKNPARFQSTYSIEPYGPYDGILRDSGESLRLVDANEQEIDSVEYDDENPWPIAADGLGASLECINPSFDNAHPRNWRAAGQGSEWQYVEITDQATATRLYFYL